LWKTQPPFPSDHLSLLASGATQVHYYHHRTLHDISMGGVLAQTCQSRSCSSA
jgi:hypothetical protein